LIGQTPSRSRDQASDPIAVPDAIPVLETIAVLDAIAVLPQTSTAQRSLIAAAPRASVVRAISGPGL
jgi:hypothetical protein